MTEPRGSVAFDRAAEYYDLTRGLSPEGARKTIELLAGQLDGRGDVLEVGVGTGQIALPLHEAGIRVIGLDLARPMMNKLVEKAGGRSPLPLVQADATAMPFRDDAFGGAYLRWVLHLIPAWRTTLAEIARVVRPGGVLLTALGAYGGPRSEIQQRFADMTGVSLEPPGLTWAGYDTLDDAMIQLGFAPRDLPPFTEIERDRLDTFIDGIANNRYSWTWKVDDPELFERAAVDVCRWAEERYGPLHLVPPEEYETVWRAYVGPVEARPA
jgi:SAM-dependent methyltransferase